MYCKECGKEIDNDSKFCNYCGTKQNIIIKNLDVKTTKDTINQAHIPVNENKPKENQIVKNIAKESKYDLTYKKDHTPTIFGLILLFVNLCILIFSANYKFPIEQYGILSIAIAFITLALSISISIWCSNISKILNRNRIGWSIFGFFYPPLALIIIGQLKKRKINMIVKEKRVSIKKEIIDINLSKLNDNSPILIKDCSTGEDRYISKKEWLEMEDNGLSKMYKIIGA